MSLKSAIHGLRFVYPTLILFVALLTGAATTINRARNSLRLDPTLVEFRHPEMDLPPKSVQPQVVCSVRDHFTLIKYGLASSCRDETLSEGGNNL